MTYITIDPGINGAVAIISEDHPLVVQKCPATISGMAEIIRNTDCTVKAVIEKVGAMPGNGGVSMFTFGQNYGQWQGILAAFGIPVIEVTPQKWQKHIPGIPTPRKTAKGEKKSAAQKSAEKAERKHYILDWVQKRTAQKIHLYAADAVAIAIVAKKLWEE